MAAPGGPKKTTGRRRPGCDLRLIEGSCGFAKNHLRVSLVLEGNIMMPGSGGAEPQAFEVTGTRPPPGTVTEADSCDRDRARRSLTGRTVIMIMRHGRDTA